MRIKARVVLICALMLVLCSGIVRAEKGTSGAVFLNMNVDARREALGDATISQTRDVYALGINPAGLSDIETFQAGFTYNKWFEGIHHGFAGVAKRYKYGTLGVGVVYVTMDEFDRYDTADVKKGKVRANDMELLVGYGMHFLLVDVGATAKYIREELDDVTGEAYALDVGANMDIGKLSIGAGMFNMGPEIEFKEEKDPLPLATRIGLSYRDSFLMMPLILSVEGEDKKGDTKLGFGAEYNIVKPLYLRAGYSADEDVDGTGVRMGIGFALGGLAIDYSASEKGIFGYTHMVSIKIGGK